MKTKKYFSKILFRYFFILLSFVFVSAAIFVVGVFYIYFAKEKTLTNPKRIFDQLTDQGQIQLTKKTRDFLDEEEIWLLVLDKDGHFLQDHGAPKQVKKDYNHQDVVRFTRWYLEDYPVFTFIHRDKILVLGYPPNLISKFPDNFFNIEVFFSTLKLTSLIFFSILLSLFFLYYYSKKTLWKEISPIAQAIEDLSQDRLTQLKESGNLKEIKQSLNKTSHTLEKNKKERENWLRGVSHDLRTPLTIISGYSQVLENKYGPSKEIDSIKKESSHMEKILEGLNVSYMLENYSSLSDKEWVDLKFLLRQVCADLLNNFSNNLNLDIELPKENCRILGQKILLERAFRNILLNSVLHNEEVNVKVHLKMIDRDYLLTISDDGGIQPDMVQELNTKKDTASIHGMGIIIVKKILDLHGGYIYFSYQDPGLKTSIHLYS